METTNQLAIVFGTPLIFVIGLGMSFFFLSDSWWIAISFAICLCIFAIMTMFQEKKEHDNR